MARFEDLSWLQFVELGAYENPTVHFLCSSFFECPHDFMNQLSPQPCLGLSSLLNFFGVCSASKNATGTE